MATTLHRIDGVKLTSGKQAYGSREMAAWLPVFMRYLKAKRKITLQVIKVADTSPTKASADTHTDGHSADSRTRSLTAAQQQRVIYDGTKYGLVNFRRTKSQGFEPHNHGALNTGGKTNSSYQIAAAKVGRDGLARNGRDLDGAHRPESSKWLRWDKGVAAMLAELDPRPTVSLTLLLRNIKTRTVHVRVKRVQKALNKALGTKLLVDGLWGPKMKSAYLAWQKSLYKSKSAIDGIPGKDSLTKLGDRTKVFRAHQF